MADLVWGHRPTARSHAGPWAVAWPISLSIHLLAFAGLYFVFAGAADPLDQASLVREMRFVEPSPTLQDRPVVRAESAPSLGSLLESPAARSLLTPSMGTQLGTGPSVIGLASDQNPGSISAIFSTSPRQAPPAVNFFGSSATGYKIVFVVDRSGSMWDQFASVRDELLASLARLDPSQQFQLIFFSSGQPLQMQPRVFLDASQANKQAAYDFLQRIAALDPASGPTDPSPALRAALTLSPGPTDVIFLLSDGDFPQTTLSTVKRLNPQSRTQVNTIGFGYRGGSTLLRTLAKSNRGSFRFVQRSQLIDRTESSLDDLLR